MSGDDNKDDTTRLLIIICSTAIMVFVCIIPTLVRLYLIRSQKSQLEIDPQNSTKGPSTMDTLEVCKYTEYSSPTPPPFHTAVKMQAPSLRRDFSSESQECPPPYNENMKISIDLTTHINDTVENPKNSEINIILHL